MEQILLCPVLFGEARRACGPGALPWMSGKDLAGLHSVGQGPAGLDLLPAPAHFYITPGSAIVPEGPEPGLGERRGRCLWARGRRVAGSSTGCASVGSSITLSLRLHLSCAEHSPEMDKDFNVCLKKCTWCPFMLGKVVFHFMGKVVRGTSASCLVSSRTQTIKKGRDFIRAREHLGNSGFPGIFADFSNGSSIDLPESSQKRAEKGQRGRSRRAPVPAGCSAHALAACGSTSAALSCRVWAAALRPWHSSSAQSFSLAFELGHFCSSPASSVVINGTPGAK